MGSSIVYTYVQPRLSTALSAVSDTTPEVCSRDDEYRAVLDATRDYCTREISAFLTATFLIFAKDAFPFHGL